MAPSKAAMNKWIAVLTTVVLLDRGFPIRKSGEPPYAPIASTHCRLEAGDTCRLEKGHGLCPAATQTDTPRGNQV